MRRRSNSRQARFVPHAGRLVALVGLLVACSFALAGPANSAPVKFSSTPGGYGPKFRPSSMNGGSDFGWVELRWSKWNRKVARGRGVYFRICKYDSSVCPNRIRRFNFKIRIQLLRPRPCNGEMIFTRMRTKYYGKTIGYYSPKRNSVAMLDCYSS